MSSTRVRWRRRRAWRTLAVAAVSLGLVASCLLNRVEFDGPPLEDTGAGGTGNEAAASGGTSSDAQGGTGATPLAGAVGSPCANNNSCESLSCSEGRCAAATCDDQITNQDETDRDCGGVCPRRCGEGEACLADTDCAPNVLCPPATRRCTASCTDRELNGAELLVDCGGGVCPGCPNGAPCATAADCVSRVCSTGDCPPGLTLCCAAASCEDAVINGSETDEDCGGGCPACSDGSACQQNTDCSNANCLDGTCISCGDGIRNGSETDADCGGFDPFCRRCDTGNVCATDDDCASALCEGDRCCGEENCAACVERLSPNLSCSGAPSGSVLACSAFLDCLNRNQDVCVTRSTPGCSDPGGVCDAALFGGDAGPALTFVSQMFADASCAE